MRYSIQAVQYGGSLDWVEICQVDNNPDAIADGLRKKMLRIKTTDGRWGTIEKYPRVRIVDLSTTKDENRGRGVAPAPPSPPAAQSPEKG
jgi:hypothetical protein